MGAIASVSVVSNCNGESLCNKQCENHKAFLSQVRIRSSYVQ
jgi:hypothetical protein